MGYFKDLTGQRFGRLTVKEFVRFSEKHNSVWRCKCDCGAECIVNSVSLKSGHTKSCGCLARDTNTKHGMSYTNLYHTWTSMKQRCHNPNAANYKLYGMKGITVCKEWRNSFASFYEWSRSHGYAIGLQIDRIDNGKGYSPQNCRWVTPKANARNRNSNVLITFNNETKTLSEWADILGINYHTLRVRYQRGWDIPRMMTTPVRTKKGETAE